MLNELHTLLQFSTTDRKCSQDFIKAQKLLQCLGSILYYNPSMNFHVDSASRENWEPTCDVGLIDLQFYLI